MNPFSSQKISWKAENPMESKACSTKFDTSSIPHHANPPPNFTPHEFFPNYSCTVPPLFFYPPPNYFPTMNVPSTIYNYNSEFSSFTCLPFEKISTISGNTESDNRSSLLLTENKLFPETIKKVDPLLKVKLWEVSQNFQKFHKLLKNIENECSTLEAGNVKMNSIEWENICKNISKEKKQLETLKHSMTFDPEFLCCLKFKINQRKKKRKYRKRMKKTRLSIVVNELAKIHMEHLQQEANQMKQEEKLKQEADNILSSVIKKKSDARYHITLLMNLLKLHSARVHQLTVETKLTVDESIFGFQTILEKLKNLWESKLHEYTMEENGLKLMIKELAVNAEDEDCIQLKDTFDKWLKFMFGTSDLKTDLFYYNYEQFLRIRQDWDKYIVDKEDNGSKIPAGWVIPKYNDDDSWKKFLFN